MREDLGGSLLKPEISQKEKIDLKSYQIKIALKHSILFS
jgi:hypothetical protein